MSETELRAMVREVLGDILKARRAGTALAAPASTPTAPVMEPVSIADDGELGAFVQRLIGYLSDPARAKAIRSGRHVFTLSGRQAAAVPAVAASASASAPSPNIELSGTVTESKITKIAKMGGVERIVLASGAVMTPLARDRVRALGLKIERKR